MQFKSNGSILSRQHSHCFCTFIEAFSNDTKESHWNTDSCKVNNHTSGNQRKDGLLSGKRRIQKVNGKKRKRLWMWTDLSGIKWKTVFFMTVEWGTSCLLFVGVAGWFVWRVVCSLGPPILSPRLSWFLSKGWAFPLQAGCFFYDASLTVMLMNALLAFTSPVSLWKWQAVYSPLAFSLKRPLHPSPPTVVVLMFNSLIRKGSGCFS